MRASVVAIVVAVFAASATLMTRSRGEDLVTIELEVRVPSSPPPLLALSEARLIAARGSTLFKRQRKVEGDVACAVEIVVKGSIGQYDVGTLRTQDGVVVNSQAVFDALFSDVAGAPAAANRWHVRVVNEISWCSTFLSAGGCSDVNGRRIAVARRPPLIEGVLWAHEVGHTQGLQHLEDPEVALMQSVIRPDHNQMTGSECDAFRK